ncbi:restriction endonuclease subunit S [Faecalibacterium prausnitzii]|uniref:restriction endonuclease subunit S n=1 Tax=Faecalibacterium prausnitzii TaxID=853 RepID=UPI001FA6C686|nr:restriction endonuclease subunit S [Faecalibacterium prausnitzii]MCI3184947.1 restriction endonuclease subunit S [Faecalibacterium prausnitzii]MCI3201011.1 restriction endonuclease subunit S [Faecalibacterium prausnitzii]
MKEKFLRELADIQTGPFGSQLHKEDYVADGTPIVTVEHLGNKMFSEQNLPRVSNTDKNRLKKYVLKQGDIVFSRVGSVDRCSYVDQKHDGWMFSGRCLRVRPTSEIVSEYLYYYFCLEETKQFVRNISVGATMPSINTKLLGEVVVTFPELEQQKRISGILSAIDSKIEVNQKINDNLAVLLQTVYQERFGDVDKAVEQGVLSDICSYSKDRVAVSELDVSTYFSTENMLPRKAGSTEATSLPTTPQTTACHKGDTLISNIRPYFKKIVYCEDECGCSTDVLCFMPNQPQYSAYLFSTLYADKFFAFMVAGAKGTKMPRGDKQRIMTYPIVLPSEVALAEFNIIALPLIKQIYSNRAENKRLSLLRDTLLPKLMSGELDVSDIDL